VDITREHYLRLLAAALACPPAPGLLGG